MEDSPEKDVSPGWDKDLKDRGISVFIELGKVLNTVGLAGFCVLSIVIYIFWFTTSDEKSEITNTWILFKGDGGVNSFSIVLMVLIILLISQQKHYKRVIKLKDQRINELANKKTAKYSKAIGNNLSSSTPKKKR